MSKVICAYEINGLSAFS